MEFRTNSSYQLVLFDRLEGDERERFKHLQRTPDFYGILRPAAHQVGSVKAVNRETALLLLTLREAGPLPSYVLARADTTDRLDEISGLVLDGVLEVRDGDSFFTGPKAMHLLSTPHLSEPGQGILARLSRDALRYAEALLLDDVAALTDRLYAFGRIPITPRGRRQFGDADAILKRLGVDPNGAYYHRLVSWGHAVKRRSATDWLGWTRRGDDASRSASAPIYKLYLSPEAEALEAVFEALMEILPNSRASAFKVGGDAAELLRPDKLVVYFSDFDNLSEIAFRLAERLNGIAAQGVPFTAEIAGNGLLSWGLDPPRSQLIVPWQRQESWRTWIARQLATALIAAQRAQSEVSAPWRFALERLRLRGVDVERWTPKPKLWQRES